jgi:hypothetical protein
MSLMRREICNLVCVFVFFLFCDVLAAEVMLHRISCHIGALQCRVLSPLVTKER